MRLNWTTHSGQIITDSSGRIIDFVIANEVSISADINLKFENINNKPINYKSFSAFPQRYWTTGSGVYLTDDKNRVLEFSANATVVKYNNEIKGKLNRYRNLSADNEFNYNITAKDVKETNLVSIIDSIFSAIPLLLKETYLSGDVNYNNLTEAKLLKETYLKSLINYKQILEDKITKFRNLNTDIDYYQMMELDIKKILSVIDYIIARFND